MALVYSPSDDSYLLAEVLERELKGLGSILEIGVGSGFQLEALEKIGFSREQIFGVDLNLDAVKVCRKKGFNVWESDLFSEVEGEFDFIIFNPPYLPREEGEDSESELITTGGENGGEVINKFLIGAQKHLKNKGKIYLLVSSLSKGIDWGDYEKKLVGEKKLFFEKLEVWELSF